MIKYYDEARMKYMESPKKVVTRIGCYTLLLNLK